MNLYEPKSFISGQWVGASQGKTFDVINPATEQLISKVADLSAADCLAAVDSAEQSFQSWAGLTAKARANILILRGKQIFYPQPLIFCTKKQPKPAHRANLDDV